MEGSKTLLRRVPETLGLGVLILNIVSLPPLHHLAMQFLVLSNQHLPLDGRDEILAGSIAEEGRFVARLTGILVLDRRVLRQAQWEDDVLRGDEEDLVSNARPNNIVLQFHRTCFILTITFLLRVCSRTLCAQWTCHVLRTRLSRIPVSCITCHWLVYSYISFMSYVFFLTYMDCRLIPGYLFVSRFTFCLVDSYTYVSRLCCSLLCLDDSLFLDYDSHFPL